MNIVESVLYNRNNVIRVICRKLFGRSMPFKSAALKFLFFFVKKNFLIIKASDFIEKNLLPYRSLYGDTDELVNNCKFFGLENNKSKPNVFSYKAPGFRLFGLKNSIIIGRSEVVIKDGFSIFPDGFNLDRHLCNIEIFKMGEIDQSHGTLRLDAKPTYILEKGISLLSDGSGNYAHFLTEVVPKLIVANSTPDLCDFPLIVDGWIGKRLLGIVNFFNNSQRSIVLVNQWEKVFVENLFCITSPTHAPQEFRNASATDLEEKISDDYKFSSLSLSIVREQALKRCSELGLQPMKRKKIYARRKCEFKEGVQYNTRGIANEEEICNLLTGEGFEIIDTTDLTFTEQVMIFSEAELVVAPLGAVLANMIFSRKNTRVIGLSAHYDGADYSYFSRMMSALGHQLVYVVGPQVDFYIKHPMHKMYTINIKHLKSAIDALS